MSTTSTAMSMEQLQQAARDHLWLHFTRMGGHEPPIIVRGEGCYLEDANGKRYLDALAGLFAVQVGYPYGEEMGQAALDQMRELPFYTNWSYAYQRAIELAHEIAQLAPGDLNRVFFVSGGSEAVESAWKLARQYHQAHGERRWKAVGRRVAYHGTTMGALSINGIAALRAPFEPLVPDTIHVRNTNRYHRPRRGAVPRRRLDVHARDHLRRPSRPVCDRAQEHRDHEARADRRERARQRRRLPGDARPAARAADRRRPARHGLLLRSGARTRQGDAGDVLRRRLRDAAPRVRLAPALREGRDLPRRRPRRSRCPDLAAAHRDPERDRRDHRHARRGPRRGMAADHVVDIRLSNLTKRFDDVVAVDDLSLEIERGRFFALLGPSGCGKTTTLRMIGGFEEPTSGRIELGDRDVAALPPYKRDVNTVFQSYALFPHLTVFENVAFGLRRQKVRGQELQKRVHEALELVGLGMLAKRKPRQLSGGQQQRIALARALVNHPRVP